MESIISTFHIDWRLLLAQLANFAIVVGVLWYFAFRPLAGLMSERTAKIEKSLIDAKKIEDNLRASRIENESIIRQAKQQAQEIITSAEERASLKYQSTVSAARDEVAKVIQEGKVQLARDREEMFGELKAEIADLVLQSVTVVLEDVVDKKADRKLVEKVTSDLIKQR